MRRRRVTYRPSKAQGAFGMVWGGVFILIGLFVVIPAVGPFGILWTLAAVAITAMNGYQAFGKTYKGPEITIEEDSAQTPDGNPSSPAPEVHDHIPSPALDAKQRLEQLESLKQAGLITQSEYDQKRREILERL